MKVVQFLGYKSGGKTRAISYVARALSRRRFRVGTVKHIHDPSFTMDTKGKDTWVHANSGARVVAAVAPRELTMITKMDTTRLRVGTLLEQFQDSGIDYLLVEGYSSGFRREGKVQRLVCARSKRDATELMKTNAAPLCVIGRLEDDPELTRLEGVPVFVLPRDTPKVIRLLGSPRGD